MLETRAMLSVVTVTSSTTSLSVTSPEIVITGTGFDPIVSNNTVAFNNGAAGIVTAATSTSLTVEFTTAPDEAGSLTAVVTSDSVSSGAAIQVATVIPEIESNTAFLAANATTILIFGYGFDTTLANNVVTFDGGAAGTVTAATSTQLTVSITTGPTEAGPLSTTVTTNSASSGSPVQVAIVSPVVTSSTASLLANATSITIAGLGFDDTPANDTIAFNNGAVGTITAATNTSLTVSLTTLPRTAGSFTAVVTSNGVSSGTAVQVASVTPVVTLSTNPVGASATTVTIGGFGFDSIAGNNTVVLNNGAVGTITASTPTSLTVSLTTKPTKAGSLTAIVTTNSINSGSAIQIAAITPVVTGSTAGLAANATSIVIAGVGFDTTLANNTVVFNNGAVGAVSAATATSLTVTFSTVPTTGNLTAIVTTNGLTSGSAVQVAAVNPIVTSSTASVAANASSMTIAGFGFDGTTPGNNSVQFNNGAVGTVTAATATQLTISLTTKPSTAGSLTAIVTTSGKSSGTAVQVASITPVVTSNTSGLAANANTLTINGFGFDPIASRNTVVLNNSAIGTVTSATTTTLTVTFTTKPATAGSITAIVTTNSLNSGTAVQAATVTPVVTSSTANLAANAATMIISGFGFDPTAGNNLVTLNNGAVGTVTAATTTSLTVTFSTRPTKAGVQTVIVTTNSQTSGSAMQVASVVPVVLANAGNILPVTGTTLTIIGHGFDTTIANNTVAFNSGAVGAVTAATATTLTVTLSVRPSTVGNLSALVTTNSLTSGSFIRIGTVRPVVTVSTAGLAANASSITITGAGFNPTPSLNTVVFTNGAIGTVSAATTTSLTVTLTTKPSKAGKLTAVVTTSSVGSGVAVQVANVLPVLTSNSAALAGNATTLIISGFGFDPVPSKNIVTFVNGAIGVVSAATATSLTVTLTTPPTAAGVMTASVQSNSVAGSSGVPVASVFPGVISNASLRLAANASSITINGYGFDSVAANNTVTFNNGAIGTVSAATATALTVNLSTPPTAAGILTAIVRTNTLSNGTAVQVASVNPVVTSNSSSLAADATTLTINGFGFDTNAASNTVAFDNGAVGTVTAATATSLTISFTTKPVTADPLNVVVTSNGVNSGAQIQVATVIPVVTSTTVRVDSDATTVTISGFGFDPAVGNNIVTLNRSAIGTVTAASATSLTVTYSTNPEDAGPLTAVVSVNSNSNGSAVPIANIVPIVQSNAPNMLAANATTLTINGIGFDTTAVNNTVVFNNGAVGTVSSATETILTITLSSRPTTAGSLAAIVTTNTVNSGTAVQVATVVPVVTNTGTNLAANATTLTINGFGFDPIAANNTVVFDNGAVGTVTTATATTLTMTLSTSPATAGNLTAIVTTSTLGSGAAIRVATVIPVVTVRTTSLAANAATLVINGFGFDTTAGNNLATFNNGAVGDVTSATATSITVTFSTRPGTAGGLTATVSTGGVSGGTAVQVARVTPVITSSTASLAANVTTLTINGFGFDPIAANNSVVLDGGAVGTVTSATKTSLSVTLSTIPTAASVVSAVVTTNSLTSGSAAQIAIFTPVVTSATTSLAADQSSVTINGFGFDVTPGNNLVTFDNGAVGTVTTATANVLTVTLSTKPATAGELNVVVTTNSISSGAEIQVATITPVVTSSTATLAANAATVIINGFGFDPTEINNTVQLNIGAIGTVTAATTTSLTVTFAFKPTTSGSLTAIVSTNGSNSGSAMQVASVRPVVTSRTTALAANASTVILNGVGFSATASQNLVVFNNGAIGSVTSATSTWLRVTFSIKPKTAGSLTAIMVSNGVSSGTAVQVATVAPVVTISTVNLAANATTFTIAGFGFDPIANRNTVVLSNGAVGTVSAATTTSLTITLSTRPTAAGLLTAIVTTNSNSSSAAIQVAAVIPTVTSSVTNLLANASSVVINGFGFDPTAANNTVVFNNGAVGTVTTATSTVLTVTLSELPTTAGSLTAIVTTNLASSGSAIQVARVVPVVASSTTGLGISAGTITLNGFGFSSTAAQNTVVFNNGAIGTVTAATPTALTVTFSTKPTTLGSLTAIVTTSTLVSGSAVQVATVIPVVTLNATIAPIDATTIIISGTGFSAVAANNTVVFNNGAIGSVTAATVTSLTVTFSTKPTTVGDLTAVVTSSGFSSGTAVQAATVRPVLTLNTANLGANASTVVISGFGFDTTAANNTVVFDIGAVGTVTSATATMLTVTLSTRPAAVGVLTAIVTTNSVTSGGALQVARVIPFVNASVVSLAANSNTVIIRGFGFSSVTANNTVVFNNGAVGAVTTATSRALTVTFSVKPGAAGTLTAIVTTSTIANSAAVQVSTVIPVVTSSTTSIAANATTVTINGFGFDATAIRNTVVFSNGAVGTVSVATPTVMTVTFSTKPTSVGNLTATVTTNSVSNGIATQVATVTPAVVANTANLVAGNTTMTITGFGFDSAANNNTVAFNNGAVGVVTAATSTTLSVSFAALPNQAGPLTAVVTTNGFSSGTAIQVATASPVVTSVTSDVSASSSTLTIDGSHFSSIPANNTVVFDNGAVGAVTSSTSTTLTVTFSVKPKTAGSLTAIVTTNGVASGIAVQVATITPTLTTSTASLGLNALTVVIGGFGFSPTAANNTVVFNNGAIGTVTTATVNVLTVTFSTLPAALGSLTAVVATNSLTSGAAVQIATVAPVVTITTTTMLADATTVVITGLGFSTTAANNTVVFNNGAIGTVSAATATSLTVTLSTKPTSAGPLTAVVTTNGASSGVAIQVAAVAPVVTSSSVDLSATANTITISGFGFSTIANKNTVVFSNGAVGTVTAATATTLTVTFSVKPKTAGPMTVIVTSNLIASAAAVQVATITPVVTLRTTSQLITATTMTINGFGFDLTAANNTVVFSNGAVGTVTASTATTLTISFSIRPLTTGVLTAIVTTNLKSSGAAIQVATIA